MLQSVLLLLLGFVMLVIGAEALVRGASGIALRLGISPLIVGLTVVAFGTSAPELAVCVRAALEGETDLAVGNVVGSNIFNIALILGVAATIFPITCHVAFVRREVPVMIATALLIPIAALVAIIPPGLTLTGGWGVDRAEGAILALGIVLYSFFAYRIVRKDRAAASTVDVPEGEAVKRLPVWVGLLLVAVGVGGLVLGAAWMVSAASAIAVALGLSQLLIGLTIVAMGTSLPELATSIVAAFRKQPEITVGNVVGSNIFNVLMILGVTAVVNPLPVSRLVLFRDVPLMVLFSLLCLPIMGRGCRIARWEGVLLLALFGGYMALLLWTEGALAGAGIEPPAWAALGGEGAAPGAGG